MSKLTSSKLKSLAKEFAGDKIVTDGKVLLCDFCDATIPVDDKHQKGRVQQHIKSGRHQSLVNKSESRPTQSFIGEALANAEAKTKASKEFELDLTRALVQSGIPIFKVHLHNI